MANASKHRGKSNYRRESSESVIGGRGILTSTESGVEYVTQLVKEEKDAKCQMFTCIREFTVHKMRSDETSWADRLSYPREKVPLVFGPLP